MATVFKKNGYELISFPGYMYVGFEPGATINQTPTMIGKNLLTPGARIKQIGRLKYGAKSSLYQELTMIGDGSYLEFAGTFEDLILFNPYRHGGKMFEPRDLFGTFKGYGSVYAGFYELPQDDFLMIVASSCAPRLFLKHFYFYESPNSQIIQTETLH